MAQDKGAREGIINSKNKNQKKQWKERIKKWEHDVFCLMGFPVVAHSQMWNGKHESLSGGLKQRRRVVRVCVCVCVISWEWACEKHNSYDVLTSDMLDGRAK